MEQKIYEDSKNEVLSILKDFTGQLNKLEEKHYARNKDLNALFEGNTIPDEVSVQMKDNWNEYKEKKREILKKYCTEEISERPHIGSSLGSPTQFQFMERYENLDFIMKSKKRASVEVEYSRYEGNCSGEQFVFYPIDGEWKIKHIKYRFARDDSWHKETL